MLMDDCGRLLPKILKPTVGVHNDRCGSKTAVEASASFVPLDEGPSEIL
jgi:hypothetical protein